MNFKGFVWVPYSSAVERLKRPSFLFRREVLQFLPYTRAIVHEGLCLDLGLLNEALLSVQSGRFSLGTGTSGVHFGLLRFEVGQVNGLAQICRFPPFQVLLAWRNLAHVLLPLPVQVGLVGTGAVLALLQLGGNEGRLVQGAVDRSPHDRLNGAGLNAALGVRGNCFFMDSLLGERGSQAYGRPRRLPIPAT